MRLRALRVAFFLLTSLRGGTDVAWRALHPRLPIDPALLRHPLRLPEGTGRTFLVNALSLLPGTVVVDVEGATLVVHTLADRRRAAAGLVALERRVAAVFGIQLADEPRAP